MLFRMIDHYDIYNNDYRSLEDEIYCLICHDKDYQQKPIKLNNNVYYLKKCKCDGYIHKKCLDKWFDINMSCPYCRKEITKMNSLLKKTYIIAHNHLVSFFIYYSINIIRIQGYIFFIFWVYFISEFYYNVLINKNMFFANHYEENNYVIANYIFNETKVRPIYYN